MAKLSNLVNVNINRNTITVQGVPIPVVFTFTSFPYIEEAYGGSYGKFEKELKGLLNKGSITMGRKETRLMHVLIYAMIRSGGTDATLAEVEGAIPMSDLPAVFQKVLAIFNEQDFQHSDMEKIKQEKK